MLKFNEGNESFVLYTNDDERAIAAGLTLSTNVRGPAGEKVYYTADHSEQPDFNPYAALDFYSEADEKTKAVLSGYASDYLASWNDGLSGSFPDIPVPEGKVPMPYQVAGVSYCLDREHSIIGDEPGLGKTIQAVMLANATEARRILIICPAAIRLNWQREIWEWSTIPRVRVYPILKGSDGTNPAAHYTIVSYDLARNHSIHAALGSVEWDLIVCDEGHYLKTIEAQRTRAIFGGGNPDNYFYKNGLLQRTKKLVSLTGTPLPNRPREAYTQCRGLDWSSIDFLSQDAFNYRFNPSMQIGTHTKEEKGRLPEMNARLRCNIMVRRHKKDVLPQLPEKTYEMTYIEPNANVSAVLREEALIDFDPMELFNPDFTLDGTPISTLRREMGEAMVPEVVDYLKYQLDIVELPKIIVFAHHKEVIKQIAAALEKYGVCIHTGGQSTRVKDEAKRMFMRGRERVFLGQLDTMEGVDGLQEVADHVFFAEPAWTPGRNEQCVDRAHRMGQLFAVIAHFLLIPGSFNEKVLHAILGKAVDIHATLDRRLI
jgi:SWI/SNF-related matrix-associated actin-dependent regulator 1 of chromatin subfamily A